MTKQSIEAAKKSGLLKQYLVRWIEPGAGPPMPLDACVGCGEPGDLYGVDFIMATSQKHAVNILREGRGNHLQIKECKRVGEQAKPKE